MQETQFQSLGQKDPLEREILQYSCLGNPMDRRAWRATVHGVAKSQTQFSDYTTQSELSSLYVCFNKIPNNQKAHYIWNVNYSLSNWYNLLKQGFWCSTSQKVDCRLLFIYFEGNQYVPKWEKFVYLMGSVKLYLFSLKKCPFYWDWVSYYFCISLFVFLNDDNIKGGHVRHPCMCMHRCLTLYFQNKFNKYPQYFSL